jgi:uncharacterized protein (DUF302 family)
MAVIQNHAKIKDGAEGLTSIASDFGPDQTMARLEGEIVANGMRVFSRINHAALAAEIGMTLRPTEVILFGNPRGGTPLMQAKQTIGIDLPLKAPVWQDASGKTWLSYNEPSWLAERHNMSGIEETVAAIRLSLSISATQATNGDPEGF